MVGWHAVSPYGLPHTRIQLQMTVCAFSELAHGRALLVPVLEKLILRNEKRGGTRLNCLAVRNGPDEVHSSAFEDSPWPIEWVAYWYKSHLSCLVTLCDCQARPRIGEGLCILRFTDGLYGYCELPSSWKDARSSITWAQAQANGMLRLERGQLLRFRYQTPPPPRSIEPCDDALFGVWKAFDAAESLPLKEAMDGWLRFTGGRHL